MLGKERDVESYVGTPTGGNQAFADAVAAANEGTDTRRWQTTLSAVGAAAWASALAVSSADLVRRVWKSAPERGVVFALYAAWTGFATLLSAETARRNRR